MRTRFLGCLALGLLGAPAAARAEAGMAPPQCRMSVVPHDASIPPNAPALVILDSSDPGASLVTTRPRVTAETGAENTDASIVSDTRLTGARLVMLAAPLDPATRYTLHVNASCEGTTYPYELRDDETESTFSTAPTPSPLPISVSTTAPTAEKSRPGYTDINVAMTKELRAYVALTMLEIHTGGKLLERRRYGAFQDQGSDTLKISVGQYPAIYGAERGDAVLCGAGDRDTVQRDLELRFHVAGAATDPPPLTVTAPIDCAPPPPPSRVRDAGAYEPGGSIFAYGTSDTATAPTCACNHAGRASASSTTLASMGVTFGLLLALSARRRHRAGSFVERESE